MRFKDFYKESTADQDYVVIYAGRFQPFHPNHYETYSDLVDNFGKENIYIATSNKTEEKSPFTFEEKKKIMTTLFDIPEDKIVQTRVPYKPVEILNDMPEDTVYIAAVGRDEATRLGGKYFVPFKGGLDMKGYKDAGYVYVAPPNNNKYKGNRITGTLIRDNIKSLDDPIEFLKGIYPKANPEVFKFIIDKIKIA